MRKVALSLVALSVAGMLPSHAYQPWYAKATITRSASASFTGAVSGSVYAAIVQSVEDADPATSPPSQSVRAYACASVSGPGGYDTGCGYIPVVIDPQAGTAQASGTITPANCLDLYFCTDGAIAVSVTWAATGGFVPAVPGGIPAHAGVLPLIVEANPSVQRNRPAAASGTLTSSVAAGTAGGVDAGARIGEETRVQAAVYGG